MGVKRSFCISMAICFCILSPAKGAAARARKSWPAEGTTLRHSFITADHAETIYRHLVEYYWTPRTGLFRSFPDSSDLKLAQQASTYEQAAMGMLAIRFGDLDRARQLFEFFKGKRGLANFYNAHFGSVGIEKTVQTGPNAWAALFAARLANTTRDDGTLRWALDIAYWLIHSVPHENGAIAMGPRDEPGGAPWAHIYATENNLSYYAMLTELLRSPRLEKDQRVALTQERDQLENWLLNRVLDRRTYRISRGLSPRGTDPIQALDAVTWFISAIGPRRVASRGIDPEKLLKSAEKTFEVTVAGHVGVDPADQTEADITYAQQHSRREEASRPSADRHRMIWYEGLGQYILAWSTLAEYLDHTGQKERAKAYMEKASALVEHFDAAALARDPHRATYPYATPGRFFRDGWKTPADSPEGPAASLISGVWRVFAGLGMDPVAGRDVGTIEQVRVQTPTDIHVVDRKPAVLYGTSEEMTLQAWRALNGQQWDQAIRQAQATIQEWVSWGLEQQKRKMQDVGQLVNDGGPAEERQKIFKYWALNDVAACYFILGKALDQKGQYDKAGRAFQQIVNHFYLAQIWDPKGWFWSPVEAISSDYVARDPAHYGWVIPQDFADGSKVGKQPF
jgi:hypothetical protein